MSDFGGGSANFDINVNTSGLAQGANQAQAAFDKVKKSMLEIGKVGDSSFRDINRRLPQLFKVGGQQAGQTFGASFRQGTRTAFGQFQKDVADLAARTEAQQSRFRGLGLDPNLLRLQTNQFDKLLTLQRQSNTERARLIADPAALRATKLQFDEIARVITREGLQLIEVEKTLNERRAVEARRGAAAVANARALGLVSARDQARLGQIGAQGAQSRQNFAAQAAAQQGLAAFQEASKRRIAITRFTLDTLGRMEKAFGATIKGIATTTVGAISKIYQGTVGSLRRNFSERRQVITGGLVNETRLFREAALVQQRANTGLLGVANRNLAFAGGGVALFQGIKDTFTIGADFTQGLRVLGASLELTAEQIEQVRQASIDLGNDITLPGVSALDAAQGVQLLSKQFAALGPAALDAALQASKGALQLQIATQGTAEDAARAIGSAVNVFGIAATDATSAADQIAQALAKSAGISFTEFSQAFNQASTVFAQFQVPATGARQALVDFNTALAVLAKGGLIGSDAGTSLRAFFLQANRGTEDSVAALADLTARAGETGTAFFDAAGSARPFTDTLNILRRGIEGLTTEQRANTLQTIFGTDAIRSAEILIGENAFAYQILRNEIEDSTGAAARFADAQSSGLRRAFDAIQSSIETLQIRLFEFANRTLGPVALRFADFIGNLISGGGAFEVVRKGLIGVAAGLSAVLAVRAGVEVLQLLARVGPLLLTPFGALAAVASGIGALFFIASQRSEGFRQTLLKMRDIAIQAAGFLRDNLGKALEFVAARLAPLFDRLNEALQRLVPGFRRLQQVALSFAAAFQTGGLDAALRNLRTNLTSFVEDGVAALQRRVPFARTAIIALGDAIERVGDVIRTFRADGIGAGFADLGRSLLGGLAGIGRGLGDALKTTIGRGIAGAGVGATIGGLIAGPLGAALGAALGTAISLALPRIRDAIARIDVGALFGKLLDGVRLVGRKIGEILSDRRTILAVAGIAAAAAALAVNFVQGFVSGILSNLGDIRSAGAEIIKALFSNTPSIVKSIAALVLLIRGALTSQFRQIRFGDEFGKVLGEELARGTQQAVARSATFGDKLKAAFSVVGSKAGQALTLGISAALSGSALGSASSGLEQGLGLAGLAGSIGAAFAVGGPAAGVAVGAVGLLTAALTANAKKAQEAKDRMTEYKEALDQAAASGESAADAIAKIFAGNFEDVSDQALRGLQDVGLSLKELQDALASGDGEQALERLRERIAALRDTAAASSAQGGTLIIPREAITNIKEAEAALRFLEGQIDAVGGAADRTNLEESLGAGGRPLVGNVQAVGAAIAESGKKAREARADMIKIGHDIATQRAEAAAQRVKTGLENLGIAAQTVRQQIADALRPPETKTAEEAAAGAVVQLPGIAAGVEQAFQTGLGTVLGSAELATQLEGFKAVLQTAVEIEPGNLLDPASIETNLETIRLGIAQSGISDEAKAQLIGALDAFKTAELPALVFKDIQADQLAAAAAGQSAAATALAAAGASGPISIQSAADLGAATTAGGMIVTTADAAARAGEVRLPNVTPDTGQAREAGTAIARSAREGAGSVDFTSVGASMASGLSAGLRSGIKNVANAAANVVQGAIAAARTAAAALSPSRKFMEIGHDLVEGLAIGIRDGASDLNSLVGDIVTQMVAVGSAVVRGIRSGTGALFDALLGNARTFGGAAAEIAAGAVTTSIRAIADTVVTNAGQLWAAGMKPLEEKTLSDRLLLQESFVSLRLGDEFGVANRTAIQRAVDAVQEVGRALLEQGHSAETAAQRMLEYRAAIIQMSLQAGLAGSEVDALLNSLGLSVGNLSQFINEANRLRSVVSEAERRGTVPPTALPEPTVQPVQQFFDTTINLPFGDPEAVALAVVNRQAQLVRT